MKEKGNAGFTLIELLVVMSIIIVISVVAVPNYLDIRKRSRDAERKSDVKTIQKALELYKNDQNPLAYPRESAYNALPCDGTWRVGDSIYTKKFPCDPTTMMRYVYQNPSPQSPADTLTYKLYACLENLSDGDAVNDADACGAGKATYTVFGP